MLLANHQHVTHHLLRVVNKALILPLTGIIHNLIPVIKHIPNNLSIFQTNTENIREFKHKKFLSTQMSDKQRVTESTLGHVMWLIWMKHVTSMIYYSNATCCLDSFCNFSFYDLFQNDKRWVFPKLQSKIVSIRITHEVISCEIVVSQRKFYFI